MAEEYNVIAEVIAQKGTCSAGHKVGDRYEIGHHTPAGLCCYAFDGIWPVACALTAGGHFSWQKEPDVISDFACPDAENTVYFKLTRVPA
ncbi:MAG: TIGR04076 family protein [Chloroflexi bacterium]|nr:TIGR04076 family protein [Chloroflexota bacterium]